MNNNTEKMLTTSWNLVRDAGSAMTESAANSRVGSTLVRNLPRLKEMASVGAGMAIARKGSRTAISALRRHPLLSIAGVVALAGVGLAVAAARRRKQEQENEASTRSSKRVTAKNMRSTGNTTRGASADKSTRASRSSTKSGQSNVSH